MRQVVDPLLSGLSVTSTASYHLSSIIPNKDTQKILPPHDIAGATQNIARVRVLISVDQQSTENSEQKGDFEPSPTIWLNNIYTESRYKKWSRLDFNDSGNNSKFVATVRQQAGRYVSPSVSHISLVKLRTHIITMVLVIDPSKSSRELPIYLKVKFLKILEISKIYTPGWISRDANLIVVRQLRKEWHEGIAGTSSQSKKNKIKHIPAKDIVSVISDIRTIIYINNGVASNEFKVTVWLTVSKNSKDFDWMHTLLNKAVKLECVWT